METQRPTQSDGRFPQSLVYEMSPKKSLFGFNRPSKKLCRSIDQPTFDKVEKYADCHHVGVKRYVARKDTRRNERAMSSKAHVDAAGGSMIDYYLVARFYSRSST
jgi:hypothetical protein